MLKKMAVGTAVAALAAMALQVQVSAQQAQGAPARRAVGGTTAGNDAYPTDDQWKNSKEAQALVAKAKAAAGNDASCSRASRRRARVLGPQRPALLRQNAGLPAEPQRQVDIVKIFDNFYFFGFNTRRRVGDHDEPGHHPDRRAQQRRRGREDHRARAHQGRSQAGGREDDHRRPRPLRPFRRRAVLPAEVRVARRDEQA